jgi:hypothetical protein
MARRNAQDFRNCQEIAWEKMRGIESPENQDDAEFRAWEARVRETKFRSPRNVVVRRRGDTERRVRG